MWKKLMMMLIVFTMFFGGGLIPSFLLVKGLGMLNTIWAIVLPSAISAWNLIVMRTFFQSIPDELIESAKIDGANDMYIFFRIVLPLSMAIVAVIGLFHAVGEWNSWFNAVIYLRNREMYPLQLFLREILIENRIDNVTLTTTDISAMQAKRIIKYAVIIVSTVPILLVYPFLQKYFVKGILIGSLKE
ncbi:carbohydrate ABC transporter permease [Paenibacillus spongiae]|uniref:Carbohydrate ABC transporter permease n=1 Tax=Paenibacillus spongiae TaxID=2909671 RepID=A0ABY5S0Q3_9BACL|nr:carbohydrate ABC transporter permease [Paenibacillus spongiae]UVI27422.1 carbohydrate ABC transporter permease [Paenibacillus spongiae]